MEVIEIPLEQLAPHPANSNVMPEALLKKLTTHIERTDRYPPVIVRPLHHHFTTSPNHQILDGHHRVEALRRLGRDTARCVAWRVDDDEALVLLATLNRLRGDDDPHRRAALVARLAAREGLKKLAAKLPEDVARLEKLASLSRPAPPPRLPMALEEMPAAVHFFLLPAQRRALDQRLRQIGGTREQALMELVQGR